MFSEHSKLFFSPVFTQQYPHIPKRKPIRSAKITYISDRFCFLNGWVVFSPSSDENAQQHTSVSIVPKPKTLNVSCKRKLTIKTIFSAETRGWHFVAYVSNILNVFYVSHWALRTSFNIRLSVSKMASKCLYDAWPLHVEKDGLLMQSVFTHKL